MIDTAEVSVRAEKRLFPDQIARYLKTAFAFAGLTVVFAPVAYMLMFAGFRYYDDEGFFLATLRDYLSGHPLLTPYVPLYGPFFYEVMGGLFKLLGLQPTHETGRWVTLGVWLIASAAGGLVTFRLTRTLWLGLAGQLVTFIGLIALANEPMSTYGLSCLLLLAMAGAAAFRSARPRATAVVIGGIVGALLLIKINVGGAAALAAVFAWSGGLIHHRRRWLLPGTAALMVAFPLVLMSSLLGRAWVAEFAIVVALSVVTGLVGVASAPRISMPAGGRWVLTGAALIVAGIAGAAIAGGARPQDAWNALFVFPLGFPRVFTWPMQISPVADVWAAAVVAAALARFVRSWGGDVPRVVPAFARVGAGLFTWLSILLLPSTLFVLALPLAWLAARPPAGDVNNPVDPYCRLLLPALAVLESLQAYPVAGGTQLAMAAFALMPVGAVILNDGIRELDLIARARKEPIRVVRSIAPVTWLMNIVALQIFGFIAISNFTGGALLGLPGADSVRLPAQQASDLRTLVQAIDQRGCSRLITYPGMNSFAIWSGRQSSPQMRYGQWWLTITTDEQRSLVQQYQGEPGVCVVRNQKLVSLWTHESAPPKGPLVDFIDANFTGAGTFGDYQLLVSASP